MAVDSQGAARSSFDLKSAQLPVMAVALRDTQVSVLASDLAQRLADDPDFFDNDPVLIDLQHVRDSAEAIDFSQLIQVLKRHRTLPVAVCNGSPEQMAAAHAAGLMPAPDAHPVRTKEVVREVEVIREVPVEVVREIPAPAANALIIDKPLRSGHGTATQRRVHMHIPIRNYLCPITDYSHYHQITAFGIDLLA